MKTKVELTQAIRNLKIQKDIIEGKIIYYNMLLENYPKTNTIRTVVKHSEEEKKAIMMFNKDKRFTITE